MTSTTPEAVARLEKPAEADLKQLASLASIENQRADEAFAANEHSGWGVICRGRAGDLLTAIDELSALREQTAASVDVLKHRYVNHDLLNMVEHNERLLVDLIESVCRLRGETDADADLKRFVHYIDHALDLSRGELSRIIDFAQGQKARADTATAQLARQAPLVEAAVMAHADLMRIVGFSAPLSRAAVREACAESADRLEYAIFTFKNEVKT